MSTIRINIEGVHQDSQTFGSSDEHMVSRVFFTFETNGSKTSQLFADVKQSVGSSYETGPLEVSRPTGFAGPLDYEAFRDVIERYYRSCVGPNAFGIRLGPNVQNVRMMDNRIIRSHSEDIPLASSGTGW